jgi:hypothetical protein
METNYKIYREKSPSISLYQGGRRRYKNKGSSLIMALLMGGMLLTLGVIGTKMMLKQVQFSSDLLLSTRAHYAAESGVERALYALKIFPVRHLETAEIDVGDPTADNEHARALVSIGNKETEGAFVFSENETMKIRLALQDSTIDEQDIAPSPLPSATISMTETPDWSVINNFQIQKVSDPDITDEIAQYQWRVLCTTDGSSTVAQEGEQQSNNTLDSVASGIQTFITSQSFKNCFLSIASLDFSGNPLNPKKIRLKITGTSGQKIAPPAAKVRVEGIAQDRKKIVEFDYRQKNLGGLFDFSLFHEE